MNENLERAQRAREALQANYENDPNWRAAVVDLLANLMHYCAQSSIDFEQALRMAKDHFGHEIAGE